MVVKRTPPSVRKGGGKKKADATEQFEKAASRLGEGRYVLRLYVAGMTPNSARAITNLKRICEVHLAGQYDLDVIDVYRKPTLAKGEQIIAAPTLIKKLPLPMRKLIGDMSDTGKVLIGLDIRIR
ncbi:circadian clock KaiB family protein [Candidatus Deferrimicrobium sp.]|jgi:circadian clock protein KaiB|uniref:circadian clock KaiB family protein n=1 Tax=Candidatus Deferrimicrobium sp. TaxID=3060586 RepID=UPI002EDB2A05